MINSFSIVKALLDKAQQVADDNSYLLIPHGKSYKPDVNTAYIEEFTLFNESISIGMADNSSDIQMPIYQLNINTPRSNVGARFMGLIITGVYQEAFKKGTQLTFNGQMIRAKDAKVTQAAVHDTHLTHILSIEFSVIN